LLIDEGTEIVGLKSRVNGQLNLYLKIDCGTHRTGFDPQDDSGIEEMLNVVKTATNLNFKGFLTHAGHSYRCRSDEEVLEIHRHSKQLMLDLKAKYSSDFPDLQISIGDTPTCSIADEWSGVDEIRPGNFTFYDVMQYHIGSWSFDEIALTMLCPIVSKHKNRNELVIYGGAVHLSKDSIVTDGHVNFGYVRKYGDSNVCLPQNYLKSLSQEHGIIACTQEFFNQISVGDFIEVFPIHSCLAANEMRGYTDKNGRIYDHFGSKS
jgi:D-serine deaminase-like pyridoxal phosphate-dependent protein